jgi:transposase
VSFQGFEFSPEMRKLVVNVKCFFDQYRKEPEKTAKSATALASAALGIGETTVKMIMATFNSGGDQGLSRSQTVNRGRPSFAVQPGLESIVRQFVRDANKKGEQVTVDLIAKHITATGKQDFQIAKSTLWRALVRWGFEFGTGTRSAQLKESKRIVIQRRQYLRSKIANRKSDGSTIRPEIYLDESFINKNHSRDSTWYLDNDGSIVGKPTGKGERLIIVNAIGIDGWVPNAELVFKASAKTGDYHTNMNWNVFLKWFQNKLMKNIPDNSLIVLDNAAYHNVLAEEAFPKKSHSIQRFQDWLTRNEIPWHKDMLKEELYDLCLRLAPKPEFQLDRIAAEKGHTILRTPPYHPELQPIETCWAVVKAHVATHNDFTMESVWRLLAEGFQKVTAHTVAGIIKKVRKQEDSFWEEDSLHFMIDEAAKEEYLDDTDE